MTRITWGDSGSRFFQAGVDRGVLGLQDGTCVPWNGLISIKEAPSGAEQTKEYYDGQVYDRKSALEGFAATLEAFTYPLEFTDFDGKYSGVITQQSRKFFNLCYRTQIGNDVSGTSLGYKIHLVYNAMAAPSEKMYKTVDDSSDLDGFSWDISTIPVKIPDAIPSSHFVIDSRYVYPWALQAFEDLIYGTDGTEPEFPPMDDLLDLFNLNSILIVTDHGDGTWTAETRPGYDSIIQMLDTKTFQISWPSANYVTPDEYTLSSL
jgi:hypothetical protein